MTALSVLAACTPIDPEKAAQRCEKQARAAQGPTGAINVGTNSETGGFVRGNIGVSTDFLAGRDPNTVYETCVLRLTGELPIRRPVLRN